MLETLAALGAKGLDATAGATRIVARGAETVIEVGAQMIIVPAHWGAAILRHYADGEQPPASDDVPYGQDAEAPPEVAPE